MNALFLICLSCCLLLLRMQCLVDLSLVDCRASTLQRRLLSYPLGFFVHFVYHYISTLLDFEFHVIDHDLTSINNNQATLIICFILYNLTWRNNEK